MVIASFQIEQRGYMAQYPLNTHIKPLLLRMEMFVFCVYLFAVYEFTSAQNSGGSDLTPRQVLSELNNMHTDFPNKMIKPILMELEKKPKLINDIKNKDLELRAAHDTNSEIKLNPVNMSSDTGSMQISHAAKSEFQIKPQRSNEVIYLKRNALEKVSTDPSKQNKIYILNLPSRTFHKNDIETNNNHGIIYDVPNSVRKLQIISNAADNLPQVTGTFTLTNQQTQLFGGPTSVNRITNPRRVVLLRRILPRRIVLPSTNIIPVFNRPSLLPVLRPVGINPVPMPLTHLIPLNEPGPGTLIPVRMPAPLCFCSAQQPQCCPLKRVLIY